MQRIGDEYDDEEVDPIQGVPKEKVYEQAYWVEDDENTELLGRVAVENWKPGDFIEAKFGGWHEIISLEDDPDDDKRMLVTRRLLSNGKQYTSSESYFQCMKAKNEEDH